MSILNVLAEIYMKEGTHLREISRKLKLGMPSVKMHTDRLLKEKLIIKRQEGRNIKFYLNRKNMFLVPYLYQIEYVRLSKLPKHVGEAVFGLIAALDTKPLLTIIFGSYAKDSYTKNSDLDLMLVFSRMDSGIEKKARLISSRYSVKIEPVYLEWESFRKKFFDEKDAFMKELKAWKIIVSGIEHWLMLEKEVA